MPPPGARGPERSEIDDGSAVCAPHGAGADRGCLVPRARLGTERRVLSKHDLCADHHPQHDEEKGREGEHAAPYPGDSLLTRRQLGPRELLPVERHRGSFGPEARRTLNAA
jgi:hypothetical protein